MNRFASRTFALLGAAAIAPLSCSQDAPPARAQWIVQVQTDAPVPSVADRVTIELLHADGTLACPACRRDAALPGAHQQPVSFGVEATSDALYLRTRAYRNDHLSPDTGQPAPGHTIESVVRLPPIGDRILTVYADLTLDCLGSAAAIPGATVPSGGDWSSCVHGTMQPPAEASTQPPAADFIPGSSPLLAGIRRTCVAPAADAADRMACVPGGELFLGSAFAPAPHTDVNAAPTPERLVGVHSFHIDLHEVTVAEFEKHAQNIVFPGSVRVPTCTEAQPTAEPRVRLFCQDEDSDTLAFCSRSDDPSVSKDLPLNCVSAYVAAAFCAVARKGRLPTEAEWEYAASNGSSETRFPWGDTRPDCSYAVLAREPGDIVKATASECLAGTTEDDATASSLAPGPVTQQDRTGLRDATGAWTTSTDPPFTAQPLFDFGGSLSEWTSDFFESYTADTSASTTDGGLPESGADAELEAGVAEAGASDAGAAVSKDTCWAPGEVLLIDRRCPQRKQSRLAVRGGSWLETLDGAWTANRASGPLRLSNSPPMGIGFRCACDFDASGACCLKNDKNACCELDLATMTCCAGGDCCEWDLIAGRCKR